MTQYERHRYLLMTQDPVHIGTGGYRLGRVDNSIVREPGTRIPKIPGTSLHGAIRAYAARLYETPAAAGQSHDDIADPDNNPVCYTFGYIKAGKNGADEGSVAYSGVVNIFDAHILLFPVHSFHGPIWVTTPRRLQDAGLSIEGVPKNWEGDHVLTTWNQSDNLNLGWLMLPCQGEVSVTIPPRWKNDTWDQVSDRIAVVHDSLFSQIVNSNLEVRTSVSIDPDTGAAKDGALFTYEAIPRATFLVNEVVLDDYRADSTTIFSNPITETAKQTPLPGGPWNNPLDVVVSGINLIQWLGVGGMGTRGFGRMKLVADAIVDTYGGDA